MLWSWGICSQTPQQSTSKPFSTTHTILSWVLLNDSSHAVLTDTEHRSAADGSGAQSRSRWRCLNTATTHMRNIPSLFLECPPPKKERELGGEVGEVAVESNGVGCWSESKGRVDRCCCQDLSVKTNGCCKDEASKTLENSDVVNHRPFCLHRCVCVCHVRLVQRARGWMKYMYRCGSRLRPSHMGQCWEIDFGGLWGRQRWICLSDYRRKIANTKR